MKYFIDTNIFLRTLVKEDKKSFGNCYRLLEMVKTNKIKAVTSSIVLAEVVWTLSSYYSFSRQKVSQAVKSILNLRGLSLIDSYDHHLALNLYQEKKVKYIDALISSGEEIQNKKMTVVSYDRDFDKLGIKRLEPQNIP